MIVLITLLLFGAFMFLVGYIIGDTWGNEIWDYFTKDK